MEEMIKSIGGVSSRCIIAWQDTMAFGTHLLYLFDIRNHVCMCAMQVCPSTATGWSLLDKA